MITVAAFNSTAEARATADFVCDGVNDQVEINAAISALGGQPGSVLLRDGNYNLGASTATAAIVLPHSNITLRGESWATQLRLQDNADVNMIRSVGNGLSGIVIETMSLDGNANNNSYGGPTDRFEHNIIRIISDGSTMNSDVWVRNIRADNANRLCVMLGGNDMHVRDSEFGIAGSDVVEVLYGTGNDISGNVARIYGTTGYVFGSDAASAVVIRDNTTHIYSGGQVTEAVHRTWGGQYYNQIVGNSIFIEEGGIATRAIEARGYQNLIANNMVIGASGGDIGRTDVEVNGGSFVTGNYFVNVDITVNDTSRGLPIGISNNFGSNVGVPDLHPAVTMSGNTFFPGYISSNNDNIVGTPANESFSGGAGFDTIDGAGGNDTLNGGRGHDTLIGGAGNDNIDGGLGSDQMYGGPGNDVFRVNTLNDQVFESANEGSDTILTTVAIFTLPNNVENLRYTGTATFQGTGNTLNNVLEGGALGDRLVGLEGDDRLDGKAGADNLQGGMGNDVYLVDNAADAVIEQPGQGTDEVRTTLASFVLGAHLENLTYTGTGVFAGTGNGENNVITGGANADTLNGEDGGDTLNGGGGDDILIGGLGADQLDGGPGLDTASYQSAMSPVRLDLISGGKEPGEAAGDQYSNIENVIGSNFADQIAGTAGDNKIEGLNGNDVLNGRGGNDEIFGGGGADTITGGAGEDHMDGGIGFDTVSYLGAAAGVTIDVDTGGTAGDALGDTYVSVERFFGSNHGDVLQGSNASDQLRGMGGDDVLIGDAGDDVLAGDAGDDTITGGAGTDALWGDAGSDTFVFTGSFNSDHIRDFDSDAAGGQDFLDMLAFGIDANTFDAAIGSGLLTMTQNGANTLLVVSDIANGWSGTVVILNTLVVAIDGTDFKTV